MADSEPPTSKENEELEERLKSSLWYHIGRIVDEETLKLGVSATPQYIGSLTELVWSQIETVAQDLESFASHAGRNTITTKDVVLLTRRNEGLKEIVEEYVRNTEEKKGVEKDKEKGKGKKKQR